MKNDLFRYEVVRDFLSQHRQLSSTPQTDVLKVNKKARDIIFKDLPASEGELWLGKFKSESLKAVITPVAFISPDLKIRSMYLRCSNDRA